MSTKKILVTGAAGFIGFHFAKYASSLKDFVIGLDNFNAYYSPELKKARASELAKINVDVVEGDIQDQALIEELIVKYEITHVVHLAAQAGVRYSLVNPDAYIDSNIKGFISILEALRKSPDVKLIFASSSSVYGLNEKTPFSVTDPTDRQASLYGATKKSNELFAQTYHHLFGITAIGLRFFTVYGPWGRPDMAYWTFAKNILEEKPISLYNFGKMERDFTYIDDIVSGIFASLDCEGFKLYNLGNHTPVCLSKFVELLEKACGKKAKITHLPMQPGDVERTFANIAKEELELKYRPKTSLAEGIVSFIEWFKENDFSKYSESSSMGTCKRVGL